MLKYTKSKDEFELECELVISTRDIAVMTEVMARKQFGKTIEYLIYGANLLGINEINFHLIPNSKQLNNDMS